MRRASSLISALLVIPSLMFGGWHERKAEGWAWYEERGVEEGQELLEHKQPKSEEIPSSTEQMQEVRKILEEKLSAALLEPTAENVQAYMEEQQKWTERSSYFAKIWTQVLLNQPYLDYTATHRPVSQYGLQLHKKSVQEEKEQLISGLVGDYGLFFFYAGEDPASSVFGKIVQEFGKKYGWEIMAISVDGKVLEGFDETKNDNGVAKALEVDLVPAIYLINPKENIVVPISFGLVAMDQIENNIALQFRESKESEEFKKSVELKERKDG